MDNGSTEWAHGLMEVTLAMNTQRHSTIGCAPVELLFRERSSYNDWLNQQKRIDPTVGVVQEDSTQPPIYTLSPSTPALNPTINIGVYSGSSHITMQISPESALGSQINVRISPPSQSSLTHELEMEKGESERTDQVIAKAEKASHRAKLRMMQKYSKRHTIQHFNIGDIISIKVPREDRTSTDNRRLFGRILEGVLLFAQIQISICTDMRLTFDSPTPPWPPYANPVRSACDSQFQCNRMRKR
ncbi:hypothetical protein VFPPC_12220 [Pochonia chlamydosporia 170]|uniref:Uncharacterized protein n=1 Tax=Pochonia chlamydosporia 170 TaxID=1380566 RepID=A0A179EZI5_METCM|nr:hypothetical protein VFPPC_12220 [Pochonia chlamydosporia 170]OAQ58253.1 hypothetical protein VFPPC_12220 [Pochonia chlamydosporia 170]